MQFTKFHIEGPALIVPQKFGDNRGYFVEAFKSDWFQKHISDVTFVQDNQSLSALTGTVRGLHYQKKPYGQGKLVRCIQGSIFDVAVDIRKNSPTFGEWIGANLTADQGEQLWIPDGFAHGFCTLEPNTIVFYKVTSGYSPEHDAGLAFDDPEIGVEWPVKTETLILSDKDKMQPSLRSLNGGLEI